MKKIQNLASRSKTSCILLPKFCSSTRSSLYRTPSRHIHYTHTHTQTYLVFIKNINFLLRKNTLQNFKKEHLICIHVSTSTVLYYMRNMNFIYFILFLSRYIHHTFHLSTHLYKILLFITHIVLNKENMSLSYAASCAKNTQF